MFVRGYGGCRMESYTEDITLHNSVNIPPHKLMIQNCMHICIQGLKKIQDLPRENRECSYPFWIFFLSAWLPASHHLFRRKNHSLM